MLFKHLPRLAMLAAPVIGLFISSHANANESEWYSHGTVCKPSSHLAAGAVDYTQFGVHNPGTSPVTVECPLITTLTGTSHVGAIEVNYYDRGTSRLSCEVRAHSNDGNIFWSAVLTSPSGGPSTGMQTLSINPPTTVTQSNWFTVHCTIPAANGGALSHVTTIFMDL